MASFFSFLFFLFTFHFSEGLKFVLNQYGYFLLGKSISQQEKKSGKMTLPPQKKFPVMPLWPKILEIVK